MATYKKCYITHDESSGYTLWFTNIPEDEIDEHIEYDSDEQSYIEGSDFEGEYFVIDNDLAYFILDEIGEDDYDIDSILEVPISIGNKATEDSDIEDEDEDEDEDIEDEAEADSEDSEDIPMSKAQLTMQHVGNALKATVKTGKASLYDINNKASTEDINSIYGLDSVV